jgi:hypothetical protein
LACVLEDLLANLLAFSAVVSAGSLDRPSMVAAASSSPVVSVLAAVPLLLKSAVEVSSRSWPLMMKYFGGIGG